MIVIFNTLIYQPFYNELVYVVSILPGNDLGLSIIVLTIAVKFLIFPFTHKSMKANKKMKQIQGEIDKIKERHKDQKEQATKIMDLYKEHGINPFSGCLFSFIQIPLIIGLYWVFLKGFEDGIDTNVLYSFVHAPSHINFLFLNYFNLNERSIFLVLCAGISQFFQLRLSFPPSAKNTDVKKDGPDSFGDVFKKSFQTQTQYILPIVIVLVSLNFPAGVPLYWVTTNMFSIAHELFVKHKALLITRPKSQTP